MNLEGKVAIVTGAARRVGRAIALDLSRSGCSIAVHYNRSHAEAETLADEIRKLPRPCHLINADLASEESWPRVVQETVTALGSLDILINNASVFEPSPLVEFDIKRWESTFRINLTAAVALCHHAAPHLARSGCGKIVNLADIAAQKPWNNHLAYCASKAALVNVTKSLAIALAPDVQVNAISPGIALFPEHYGDDLKDRLVNEVPLRRPGTPEDVARTVRFLCADGDYITGQDIAVDGGRSVV